MPRGRPPLDPDTKQQHCEEALKHYSDKNADKLRKAARLRMQWWVPQVLYPLPPNFWQAPTQAPSNSIQATMVPSPVLAVTQVGAPATSLVPPPPYLWAPATPSPLVLASSLSAVHAPALAHLSAPATPPPQILALPPSPPHLLLLVPAPPLPWLYLSLPPPVSSLVPVPVIEVPGASLVSGFSSSAHLTSTDTTFGLEFNVNLDLFKTCGAAHFESFMEAANFFIEILQQNEKLHPDFFVNLPPFFAVGTSEWGEGSRDFDGIDGRWRGLRLAALPPDFDGSDAGVMGEPTPCPLLATISGNIYLLGW
ncbi:hypothetical protein B0H14DRAFT_2556818 [Mycena olivaceomarginata]|nr:hypothetical protein B0H14DRAFT_2556818 [Mycena olivaceomarginata]